MSKTLRSFWKYSNVSLRRVAFDIGILKQINSKEWCFLQYPMKLQFVINGDRMVRKYIILKPINLRYPHPRQT